MRKRSRGRHWRMWLEGRWVNFKLKPKIKAPTTRVWFFALERSDQRAREGRETMINELSDAIHDNEVIGSFGNQGAATVPSTLSDIQGVESCRCRGPDPVNFPTGSGSTKAGPISGETTATPCRANLPFEMRHCRQHGRAMGPFNWTGLSRIAAHQLRTAGPVRSVPLCVAGSAWKACFPIAAHKARARPS